MSLTQMTWPLLVLKYLANVCLEIPQMYNHRIPHFSCFNDLMLLLWTYGKFYFYKYHCFSLLYHHHCLRHICHIINLHWITWWIDIPKFSFIYFVNTWVHEKQKEIAEIKTYCKRHKAKYIESKNIYILIYTQTYI